MNFIKKYKLEIFSIFLLILAALSAFFQAQAKLIEKKVEIYEKKINKEKALLKKLSQNINTLTKYIMALQKFKEIEKKYEPLEVDYTTAINTYNQILTLKNLSENKNKLEITTPQTKGKEFYFYVTISDPKLFNDITKNLILTKDKLFCRVEDYKDTRSKYLVKLKLFYILKE